MTLLPFILLAKNERFSTDAAHIASRAFGSDLAVFQGRSTDDLPLSLEGPRIKLLLSFLSPWIVPQKVLERCDLAINFHPGSRRYPGIGCYNFALYEEAAEFGAVCHHMKSKVDTGDVIAESLFRIVPDDSVETLKLRTMIAMSALFAEIVDLIASGKTLPVLSNGWSRRPFTRRELNELCDLTVDMTEAERRRRIRATTYPGAPGPVDHLPDGSIRSLPVPERAPIA